MKHKTALKGFLGLDWAIEESWMKNAVSVLMGVSGEIPIRENESDFALFVQNGERPDGCRYTYIDGTKAIVDIYGAIIPRANMLSEWSGGVSCQGLAKDIAWIKNNDIITDVLFVIHSPGGEVTSVSETANLIVELGKTKTTTAYISGMGCSAAYWLASACQKIYANETAIVGSIGVMSVYVDDTKQMEMIGIDELEFISSQSPNKNPDPATPKGKQSIQARIDSLAQVFIENVAKNRGVSTAAVLKNFGQGGVFVGLEAVKAGLADQIGNFSDAYALIEDGADTDDIDPDIDPDETTKEKKMADKQETATVAVDKAEFGKLQNQLATLQAANETTVATLEKLQAEKALLEKEKLDNRLKEVSKGWHGESASHLIVLHGLVGAFGTESVEFKSYVATQTALSSQLEASSLFAEIGSARGGEEKTAFEELTEKAKAIQAAENIPFENAFAKAANAHPELYAKYNQEK